MENFLTCWLFLLLVDKIALDAGHADIVEILTKGIQMSPILNGKDHTTDEVIDSNGHVNGDTPC